jgi:hypothetical protein
MIDLMPSLGLNYRNANFRKTCPFHKNRAVNLQTIMKNRAQRLNFFLVVWLTMFSCIFVQGQNADNLGKKSSFLPIREACQDSVKTLESVVSGRDFERLEYPGSKQAATNSNKNSTYLVFANGAYIPFPPEMSIPQNLYYIQSGIMCKEEWQLEKATHIPFRIRIGSLDDCNKLEGKR